MTSLMIILVACTAILYLLSTLCRFLYNVWWTPIRVGKLMRLQGIKGPAYSFLHGNTKEISSMMTESMANPIDDLSHNIFPRIQPHVHLWVNKYGRNYLNWYGTEAQLVVTEANLIKEILTNKDDSYPKIELQGYSKKLLGDGLSAAKGQKWAKLRKLSNHVFYAESLKDMIPNMITSVEEMLEGWKIFEGKEIEVFEEFRVLSSQVISKTAFGSSYAEGKNIFEMLMKLTLIVSRNAHKIRIPGISRLFRSADDIESAKLEQGIKDCIMEIIKKREKQEQGNSQSDFLQKLVEANRQDDKNKWISVEEMVDECKTFYFAGHETTTSLLGWTIFLLATHKDWQHKARSEVLEFFGQTNPNSDGIPRLKIMNMIIEESLRLYPPVPALKRKVKKRVELGKLILPGGMELYISPLAVHHDRDIWGEDADQFNPERFERGVCKATSNNSAAAFLPFGFGPRTCVGLNFAIMEAKIALAMILQSYTFTLSPNYVHSPIQVFMIRPRNGVQIILHSL